MSQPSKFCLGGCDILCMFIFCDADCKNDNSAHFLNLAVKGHKSWNLLTGNILIKVVVVY